MKRTEVVRQKGASAMFENMHHRILVVFFFSPMQKKTRTSNCQNRSAFDKLLYRFGKRNKSCRMLQWQVLQ